MDFISIPKMQAATSGSPHNNNDHSTLEVAIGAPDYAKEVVHPPYAYLPPDQQQQYYDPHYQNPQYYDQQSPHVLQAGGSAWGADTTSATVADASTVPDGEERRICGLRRRTFFITAWVVSLLVAIAIGVGAGLGATMGSRNGGGGDSQAAAATNTTTGTGINAVTGSSSSAVHTATTHGATPPVVTNSESTAPDPTTASPSTSSSKKPDETTSKPPPPPPAPTTTTPPKPTTTSSTSTPTNTKLGGIGGRCANEWGADCICLDDGVCANRWMGTAYTGFEGNWPCPDDADNIMACVVRPCLGQTAPAQCLWREACREVVQAEGGSGAAICPGSGDFVCCAHGWGE